MQEDDTTRESSRVRDTYAYVQRLRSALPDLTLAYLPSSSLCKSYVAERARSFLDCVRKFASGVEKDV